MAGKSAAFENDLLKLIFNATTIAGIAQNDGGGYTNLYVSLHTADPGDAGTQATSETTYTGYARVPVLRTSGGWTVTGSSVSPVNNVDLPQCTGGTAAITYVGVGVLPSGAGKLLYAGAISPSISVAPGVVPRITTASTITEA